MEVEPPGAAVSTPPRIQQQEDTIFLFSSPPSYWSSPEVHKLSGNGKSSSHDGEQSVKETLERQITVLQTVCKQLEGWQNVVHDRDKDDLCSKKDIFSVKGRLIILCFAYQLAVETMNKGTWKQCCIKACSQLTKIWIAQATHFKTVQEWNVKFRKDGAFLHPNNIVRCRKRPQPLLFLTYPQVKQEITSVGLKKSYFLTVELVYSYCLETLFPRLFEIKREEMQQAARSLDSPQNDLGEQLTMHNSSLPMECTISVFPHVTNGFIVWAFHKIAIAKVTTLMATNAAMLLNHVKFFARSIS